MKLRGLVPNSYIHVSVSDLYIPTIGLAILPQENGLGLMPRSFFSGIHKSDYFAVHGVN
jgi:hypothetical protein